MHTGSSAFTKTKEKAPEKLQSAFSLSFLYISSLICKFKQVFKHLFSVIKGLFCPIKMPESALQNTTVSNGALSRWALMGHLGDVDGTSLFTLPLNQVGGAKAAR